MASQTVASGIFQENYRFLQQYVYTRVGIVLEDDKHYLFESRLGPIVKELGLASINDLCVFLHKERNAKVAQQVDEAMTTNETYFFRDPRQYEAIRTVLLPKLRQEQRAGRSLRFWSAASSTGQEAYSLAMLLLEEGFKDQHIEILGTDFCSKVVERARSGVYQQIEVNRGLPTSLLVKYFERSGLEWKLSETVRRMAHFERIDLRNRMNALGSFDLVFCRNVMIYFDEETKRKVLKEIHGTLSRGGWLILGGTETAFGLDEWYEREIVENITVYIAR
jgi:chemotaxis protein methyltransferase CheR